MIPHSSSGQNMAGQNRQVAYYNINIKPVNQVTLSSKEEGYIKSSAERVLLRFMNLLNFIATSIDIEIPELEKVIRESYTVQENKIFIDSTSLIKDDLGSTPGNKASKDKYVSRYLKDFDLLYKKSKDFSVEFSNFKSSNIKTGEYLHINVMYDCLLKNKSTTTNRAYVPTKKVAELKVEKINNKWKTWIINVAFSDSLHTIGPSKNDVVITDDPVSPVLSTDADNNIAETNSEITGFATTHTPDELYDRYLKEALFAENAKKIDEAIRNYQLASNNKPGEAGKINLKIQQLTTRKNNLVQLEEKYIAGQFRDALNGYEVAIKDDPRYSDYYLGRAKCYEQTKDFKQAMKDYNKALEYDASNADIYKRRAALHEITGDYSSAIIDYTACAGIDKSNPYILHKIAFLYILSNQLNPALEAIDKAISINNKVASFYHLKGELQLKLKKAADALGSFSIAAQLDSTKAITYFFRGLSEVELNDIENAGKDFDKSIKLSLDSDNTNRIQQIGLDFFKAGCFEYDNNRIDSSISKFKSAIMISPRKDLYRFKLAECFFRLNNFMAAIQNYSDAISLNNENYETFKQRGRAYLRMSKYTEALADFSTCLQINPRLYQLHGLMGAAYYNLHDYNNAIAQYDTAIARYSKTNTESSRLDDLYNQAGLAYSHAGNPFKAIQNFDNAIKINNNSGSIYFNRGWAYLNFNELNKAEEDITRALLFEERQALWNLKLGELYQKKEAYDLAISQYNLTIKYDSANSLSYEPLYNRAICFTMKKEYASALNDFNTIRLNKAEANFKYFNKESGYSLLQLNQSEQAMIDLDLAIKNDPTDFLALYYKSVALIKMSKSDEAIVWLGKALSSASGKIKAATVILDFAYLKDNLVLKDLLNKYY